MTRIEIPSGPIRYSAGYKYQLEADLVAELPSLAGKPGCVDGFITFTEQGQLTVHSGYAWDGPSGPTIDTPDAMRGSLVHDALYQLMREGVLPQGCRPEADKILATICQQDGMDALRAAAWYVAVREFAGPAAARRDRRVFEAPAHARPQRRFP